MNFGSLLVQTETFNMTYIPQRNKLLKIFAQSKKTSCKTNYYNKGFFFKSISNCALPKLTKLWSVAQSSLPKVLNFLAKPLLSVNDAKVYVDLLGYNSPSIIPGDEYRPDMLLLTSQKSH